MIHPNPNNPRQVFPLQILRMQRHQAKELHSHVFYELVAVVSGRCRHVTSNESHPLEEGDIFLIKPGQVHGYETSGTFSIINYLYLPDILALPYSDLTSMPGYQALFVLEPELRKKQGFHKHLRLSPTGLETLLLLTKEAESYLDVKQPGNCFAAIMTFQRLLFFLAGYFGRQPDPSSMRLETLKLSKLFSFMASHCGEPLTLTDLNQYAGMSESTLYRLCHQTVGRSPIQHLNFLRLERAQKLLLSDLSIKEVSHACGFMDSNYFTRQFRQKTGLAPSAFRRKYASFDI